MTVELMLQANPSLTPNLVKGILEYTATFQPGVSPLKQGAGFMNTAAAIELTKFYATAQPGVRLTIDPAWSQHFIWGNHLLSGGVVDPHANAWQLGVEWGSAKTLISDGDNTSGARSAPTATTSCGAPPIRSTTSCGARPT